MKRIVVLLFVLVILFTNCLFRNNYSNNQGTEIEFELLDDSIKIPLTNEKSCTDTLFFRIENNSKYSYKFLFDGFDFYFNNNYYDSDDTIPSIWEGINLRFYDEKGNQLKSLFESYYIPEAGEGEDLFPLKNIVFCNSGDKILLKAILRFPYYEGYGEFHQEILNPEKAKFVKIVYEPVPEMAKAYLEENKVKINDNYKYLKKRFTFWRPVSFNCK